tara:strand:- start:2064 stop:2333 length:270 start_codon:yes stop_codon:yes gene_type:complete
MTEDTIKKLILTIYAMQEECRHLNNGGGSWVASHFIHQFDQLCHKKMTLEQRIEAAAENVFIQAGKYEAKFLDHAKKHTMIQLSNKETK